ncbi:hypothetical protein N9W17_01250 [Jannaschia sp.]|nr:hypothetical protein [Jannaschia sp.]
MAAHADERVEQCVHRFFDECSAAMTDPEKFLESFAERDGAHIYMTPDQSTRIASVTSARDLESGAGIWERFGVSDSSGNRYISCSFDCSFEDEEDQKALAEDLRAAIDVYDADVTIVGGELTDDPDSDIGIEWWGGRTYYAHGWADAPAQVALVRQHCCGIVIHGIAQTGSVE